MIYGTEAYEKAVREIIVFDIYKKDPYYEATTEHEEELAPHLYGTKPDRILERKRPREDDEIRQYRIDSYEPVTMATAEKGLSIVSKIWNPRLSSVKPKETDKGKDFFEYMMKKFPKFQSVIRYMSSVLTKKMIADANAWAVVVPDNPLAAPTERLEPNIRLYGSSRMQYFDGETYLFRTKTIQENKIATFMWVDKQVVMQITVEVLPQETITTIDWAYPHDFNEFPCWQMQGTPAVSEDDPDVVFYRSFFYPAVPFWNKAINCESDLDGAFTNHMHPIRVEIAEDCDYMYESRIRCAGGRITLKGVATGGKDKIITCPGCNGTGKRPNKGAFGIVYIAKDKLDPDGPSVDQAVSYVSVPVEPTKMLDERVDKMLERGLHALNMDVVNKIGENQSGIAKEQDRTELNTFLQKISDICFDEHLKNAFYFCARYRYERDTPNWEEVVMPEINKPADFDINSLNEMIEQLKQANETGMNASYRKAKQIAIQNKEFSSYPDQQKRLNTILELDPLPQAKQEEVDAMLMSRATTQILAIIHCNLDAFVGRAIEENKDFLDMNREEQMEILTEYAQEVVDENKVTLDLTAIENDNTGAAGGQPGQSNGGSGGGVRNNSGEGSGGNAGKGEQNSGEA